VSADELRRILVIDDEPDILTVTQAVLRSLGGLEAEVCSRAQDAVEHAERFAPDMILLDVMMPSLDGPATLDALRAQPATRHTPVVFMTAKVMPDDASHYGNLDVAGVIAKPFEPRALVERLRAIWSESADRRRGSGSDPTADDGPTAERVEDALQDVVASYGTRLPSKLTEILAAFETMGGDAIDEAAYARLYQLTHRLAGTAATFGFPEVGSAAAALERAVEAHVTVGERVSEQGSRELSRCVEALRESAPA
jgi:two-component system OmpR family response regulator